MIKLSLKTLIKLILLIVIPVGLIVAYGLSGKSEWRSRKPAIYKDSVRIKVGDKVRTYYSLYADAPITLSVGGPVRLRAITRLDFDTAISRTEPYEIRVYFDGESEYKSFKKKSKPSFLSTFVDVKDRAPGKIRDIYLDVPKGKHTIVFAFETHKTDKAVRMRFLTRKEGRQDALLRKAKKWTFIEPAKSAGKVELYIENNKRNYYRLDGESPLEIAAKGPSLLRILTRFEFSDTMKEYCDYDLAVYEDSFFKTAQYFQVKRATKAAYAEETNATAGIKKIFLIDVPEGKHHYRIELKKPKSGSVLCRPFIKLKMKID